MKNEQYELFSKIPLNFVKNVIHPGLLHSIINDQEIMVNQFQKQFLKPLKIREVEYYDELHKLKNTIEDFHELTLIGKELRYCKEIISEADNVDYFFTWYDPIYNYKRFLKQKYLHLTKMDNGSIVKHPNYNNQEVVCLYLWKYNNKFFYSKNESQLASYLESSCTSSSGKKICSARSIISRIKSNDIDMDIFISQLKTSCLNFDFINH